MPDIESFAAETNDDRGVRFVVDRLADELDGSDGHDDIRPDVESEFRRFDNARVREFVPVFVERRMRANLRTFADA